MKKHEGCVRQYRVLSESWYFQGRLGRAEYTEEILFGMYHPEGGTTGEFAIRWIPLGGESTAVLTAFSDAWNAMMQFPELLEQMARWDGEKVTPEMVKQWLKSTAIEDATERIDPRSKTSSDYQTYLSKPTKGNHEPTI